jgi:hypothetical protein
MFKVGQKGPARLTGLAVFGGVLFAGFLRVAQRGGAGPAGQKWG